RMGRFLMNLMLASGGYPWTVIPVGERKTYMDALEKASVGEEIVPFADFLAGLVKKGLASRRTAPSGPEGFFMRDGGEKGMRLDDCSTKIG
ncbi:MAG: hypothetical protein WBW98_17895, partial [Candidatus Sulfotelmatobacter sp.]